MSLSQVTFEAIGTQATTVIFLLDPDDINDVWVDIAKRFQRSGLHRAKFILLRAPEGPRLMRDGSPKREWYLFQPDALTLFDEDEPGMNNSMAKINKIIQQEIDSGTPANRIVLAGFGQAGVMTLFTGLQSKDQLAGMAVISGYLPISDRIMTLATKVSKSIPIYLTHGTLDNVILFKYGEKASQMLSENGYDVVFREARNSRHEIEREEMSELMTFIMKFFMATD
ncbi:hypothetical protein GGI00_001172 [Coemansia sp. RSA 2681]|nr:hypothetical protein GGI00_001172 [Coemansia sp. RSA 2681]